MGGWMDGRTDGRTDGWMVHCYKTNLAFVQITKTLRRCLRPELYDYTYVIAKRKSVFLSAFNGCPDVKP